MNPGLSRAVVALALVFLASREPARAQEAAAPDLTVTKTHIGPFTHGDGGRYTVVVHNIGSAASAGTISVTAVVPAGLTPVALSGSGWTCTLATRTCTRADVLPAAQASAPISLAVDIGFDAPPTVIPSASVSGGGESDTSNNTARDLTEIRSSNHCGGFAPAAHFATGSYPRAVTGGDFNGDDVRDLAVIAQIGGGVAILSGNGDGTFDPPVIYGAGLDPSDLAAGDFDGDGDTDLATPNRDSDDVSVLLGNGDGTFATAVNYPVSDLPTRISVADVDRDQQLDLVVVTDPGLAVLRGTGDGTFGAEILTAAPSAIDTVIVDLDGDGLLDAASAGNDTIEVMKGNGDGSFETPAASTPATDVYRIAAGDLDHDAVPDLIAFSIPASVVYVLLGNGDATFDMLPSRSLNWFPSAIAVDELNGDGFADVVLSGGHYLPSLAILPGNGDGTFGPAVLTESFGNSSTDLVVDDFDANGIADIATIRTALDDVVVLLGGCPDLTIEKTHEGNFVQGQSGATYTLSVRNAGPSIAKRAVTVTDTLPRGLTATAMHGDGWTCDLSLLTCTRSDALAVNASYPPISVIVDVSPAAPATVVNVAQVFAEDDQQPGNDTASDATTIIGVQSGTDAWAISPAEIVVTWPAVAGATSYTLLRSSGGQPFVEIATPSDPSFIDGGLQPDTTYLYRVRTGSGPTAGPAGPIDLATTVMFTDEPLGAGSTVIRARHLTELRTAVNAVRAAAGLAATSFTDAALTNVAVKAIHVTELRSALAEARNALGLAATGHTDPVLGATVRVKAAHFQELRNDVQ